MTDKEKYYGEASRLNVLRYLGDEFEMDEYEANKMIDRNLRFLARGIVEDWSAVIVGDCIVGQENAS